MSEFVDNYRKVIDNLNENQFRNFVLIYLKEYYAPCEVTFVDGPYDGGIDAEIRKKRGTVRIQTQVTVQQEGLEKKILSDVDKAAKNVDRYEYLDSLSLFVNHSVSYSNQMKLRKVAKEKGINLHINDSHFLAERCDEYSLLREFLYNVMDLAFPRGNRISSDIQIVYDAVSQQKGIKSIKEEIIKIFFLKVLFDKGEANLSEIIESLDEIFMKVVRHHYYESLLGKMKGVDVELVPGSVPKKYRLLPETKDQMDSLLFSRRAKIVELKYRFEEVCQKNGISVQLDDIYPYIEKMYDDSFIIDPVLSSDTIRKHIIELKNYLKDYCGIVADKAEYLTSEFLKVFELNDFAGRQSASKVLLNLFKDNRLEDYLASRKRSVFFDTPVLIQYICFLFKDMEDYDYPPYQYVRSLINSIEDSKLNIARFTLDGYMKEVSSHLCSALMVSRFLQIPEVSSLGKSKNSFYNFFIEVSSREDVGSIEEYISDMLGLDYLPSDRLELENLLYQTLRSLLKINGLDEKRRIDVDHWMDYKKVYDFALVNTSGERKSASARMNDLNAILYMSYVMKSGDNYFVTWDTSFENARSGLKKAYPDMEDWYLYSPQQLASTFSLLNFKINPSYVTGNIVSIVEGSLAANYEAKSIVDTISEFLNGSSDSQMKVARNLAKIHAALYKADVIGNDLRDEKPIDDLLVDTLDYTSHDEGKYELFIEIMKSEEHINGIVKILSDYLIKIEHGNYDKSALHKDVETYLNGFEIVAN